MRKQTNFGKARKLRGIFIGEPLEARYLLTTYPVTTTADSGAGSLRQAILNANTHTGLDTISFQLTGSGVHTISPASPLPAITDPVIIDGSTQTGYTNAPLIQIDGASAGTSVDGLDILGGGSTINALIINNFNGDGISIYNGLGNNIVENCYLGTGPAGAAAAPNFYDGVAISGGSSSNQILNNLISGNGTNSSSDSPGIDIFGTGTDSNTISGNEIGTDITGTKALGNSGGVIISTGASFNTVSNNLISANGLTDQFPGIQIWGSGANSNVVIGNKIGTDITGSKALGNGGVGILINDGAQSNRVGTNGDGVNDAAERNIISANGVGMQYPGVQIADPGTNNNIVAGNYIGTDLTGTLPLGNGGVGVLINNGAQSNRVGVSSADTDPAGERNIISANGAGVNFPGVDLSDSNTNDNIVAGNFIGTDVNGTHPLGNGGQGVLIQNGAQSNRVGVNGADANAASEKNVISDNGFPNFWPAVEITDSGTNQNVLAGNYIGTDVTGTVAMGNEGVGVMVHLGAADNRIGTNGDGVGDALERNVIANSGYQGMYIADPGTTGNIVAGNYIGAGANGAAMGNDNNGIWIDNGAAGNRVGTSGTDVDAAGEGNLIIANGYSGILLTDPTSGTNHTNDNEIRGNSIHNNGAGYMGINLGGDFNLNHGTATELGPNNFQNYPVLLSGAAGAQTVVSGNFTASTGATYTLDFYANTTADSPFDGTGDQWLGSMTVNTGATGTVSFTATVGTASSGQWITATATDGSGNTSEFSVPIQLPAVQAQINAGSWTPIGPAPIMESQGNAPTVSGRVSAAAVDPTNSNVVYIATDGGGVWKTTDWLDTVPQWTPLTDSMPSIQFTNISYTALAVSVSNPQTIYAAVSWPGGGILKSTNGGATWTELANSIFNFATFGSIVVDPTNANTIYASVWYGPAAGGGVYKSTDGGNTWTNTTSSFHNGSAADLVMDPNNSSILYTGLVGDTTNSGANNGIYETANGGATWTLLSNGVLSGAAVGVSIRLAMSPSSPSVLYATVFDPALGNAPDGEPHRYKTVNGGASWTALSSLPSGDEFRYWHALLSVDPHNSSIVYVNGDHTLFQSTDGGTTWTQIYAEDPVNVEFDDSGAVIMTGDRGIYRWTGGTSAFQNKQGNLQDAEFYTLTLDPTNPQTVYGIAQDQLAGLKTTGSPVWNYMGGADEVGRVVVDPTNPSTLYEYDPNNGGTAGNIEATPAGAAPAQAATLYFVWKSTDGGRTWSPAGTGIPTNNVGFNLAYTSQRAFEMDPTNDNRLLVGVDSVYQTTNGGTSWTAISPVLSTGQFISDLAIAPSAPNTVYAGTGDGKLFVTTNDSTWTERDTGLPINQFARVMDMQVDPTNSQEVFAAVGGSQTGFSDGNHVYMTTNGGTSWTNITGNLPNDDAAQCIAVDWRFATPRVYVGTLRGVFLSTDPLGADWSSFGGNMPNTIVTDLELSTTFNVLAAATYGRGAFEIRVPGALSDSITGTSSTDVITLIQDSDKQHIDWTLGNNVGQLLINDPNGLSINGNGGNDVIDLAYTNGDPLPSALHLNGTFTLNGLADTNPLAGTSLDIGRGTVFISYSASDPFAAIKGYINAGYNNGAWNGTPTASAGVITSSAAAANHTAGKNTTAIGYADSADGQGVNTKPNTIELTYTLYGDANLDHQVNSADLQILLAFLNRTGAWDQGDFNYDGQVNSADLQAELFTLNTSLGNQATPALVAASANLGATPQNQQTRASAALTPSVSTKPAPHPKLLRARGVRSKPHR
ncbi:MAG TPA: hypothetical protein VK797_06095 [Tepidisphaeraceae bacterium]|nr:hypothetical protein [Tepidisphaeraceae bacterium]